MQTDLSPLWSAERRILALDGGGVRGVVSLAFLERIEALLRAERGGDTSFRLCDHFHLIGGTSTGAIIAAALATGHTVDEIKSFYLDLGAKVFRRTWWRVPFLLSKFDVRPISSILAKELGDMRLDDPAIRTLLAIIAKRVDTGSPWIVSNLPGQPYWDDGPAGEWDGNRRYRLANIVRASTAAPSFFAPEQIEISAGQVGTFVDGGITPYNNPSLPLLMLATIRRYGLNWPTGADKLSIVSIGTGSFRHRLPRKRRAAAVFAIDALQGLIADGQATTLALMQWLGQSPAPRWLNGDLAHLDGDNLAGAPLFIFQRFDVDLEDDWLARELGRTVSKREVKRLRRIDSASAMKDLYELARLVAEREIPTATHLGR